MIVYTLFLVLEILIVLGGIAIGYRRGLGRTFVRFVELAVIAIVSLFLGRYIAGEATGVVKDFVLAQFGESIQQYASASSNLEQLIAGLIGALLVPIFFALIFGVLKLVTLIGFGALSRRIVHGKIPGEVKLEKGSRWGGAGLGLVSGVLVAAIVLSPLFSYLYIAGSLSDQTKETLSAVFSNGDDASVAVPAEKKLLSAGAKVLLLDIDDLIPEDVPNFPINEYVSRIATKAEGTYNDFSANDAVPELVNMATDVYKSYTDAVSAGDGDLSAILSAATVAVSHMENSDFLPEITSSVLNVTGEMLKNGDYALGLEMDTSNVAVQSILNSVSEVLINTSPENIRENMKTLVGDVNDDADTGAIGALSSIDFSRGEELFTDDAAATALADALLILSDNPAMDSVMESLRQIGADLINQSGVDLFGEGSEQVYAGICDRLETLVSETAENKDDFRASVDAAVALLRDVASEAGEGEAITDGQYKLIAICLVQFVCTEENYAEYEAGTFAFTTDDIKAFFGAN